MEVDFRWKQRFNNFEKATKQLQEFIELDKLNKFEVQGLIQCFEYTFELAWKTMKDYLELEGFEVKSPRSTIQTAFHYEELLNERLKEHIDRVGILIYEKDRDDITKSNLKSV